ncbi:MAG TPA: GxxExxY protein [Gemmatimonadaceae bacterium]|nr:GxxExxY protein [Gemmatimonadaceae bacterium]
MSWVQGFSSTFTLRRSSASCAGADTTSRGKPECQCFFRGERIGLQRLDMVVDQQLVVEVKAAESALDYGSKQLFSYLRATRLEVGLLFSFGAKPVFKRVVCRNALKADKAGHDGHDRTPV